jgi:bile-acid 7alpha-dehydratase
MGKLEELEARIQRIEDVEAIKRLKYKYWRCLDTKSWDEMEECFVEAATASYGDAKYSFSGRDAIVGFFRKSMGPESGLIGVHQGHHPEIELLSPTTARGCWSLYNYLHFKTADKRGLREAAFYRDEYVKVRGAWKIQHTGYTYIFHEQWSNEDNPSLRLLAPAP